MYMYTMYRYIQIYIYIYAYTYTSTLICFYIRAMSIYWLNKIIRYSGDCRRVEVHGKPKAGKFHNPPDEGRLGRWVIAIEHILYIR